MIRNKKRFPSPKGRTDLGVGPDETGVYLAQVDEDEHGRPKTVTVYRLRNIRDGMVRDLVDDGLGREGVPLNGRQNVMRAISKEHAVFEGNEEVGYPMFFLDKRVDRQFSKVGNIPVQVATKEVKEEMARCVEARNRRRTKSAAEHRAEVMTREVERLRAEAAAKEATGSA